jgi:hypothetical protein
MTIRLQRVIASLLSSQTARPYLNLPMRKSRHSGLIFWTFPELKSSSEAKATKHKNTELVYRSRASSGRFCKNNNLHDHRQKPPEKLESIPRSSEVFGPVFTLALMIIGLVRPVLI